MQEIRRKVGSKEGRGGKLSWEAAGVTQVSENSGIDRRLQWGP